MRLGINEPVSESPRVCVRSQPCLSALLAGRLSPFCGRLGGFSGPVLPSPPWLLSGRGGPQGGVFTARLGLPWPLPSVCLLPQGHRFPCHVGRELPACLQEQPGLVLSAAVDACSGLDNPGCVPGAGGPRKRPGSGPSPAGGFGLAAWRWGPWGALFSRASAFPAALPVGANAGQGGGPELSERGADAGSGAFLLSHRATRGHEQRCDSWGLAPLATFSEPGALSGLF